ncbi:MAG: YbhB/YbcL family Raf kinase inhibitor-like protein [Candidatus Eremiobacteraeota bacterium]|nr:YbhB/YbcL family Raf kinase inhibitor-like protein [Candidatus Eremiobacteraeota bacterium]
MGTLTVSSTTFSNGGTIPVANVTEGCGGPPGAAQRISPQVSWTAGPPGTGSYAVTMFDTDAPTGTGFWHWIVFNIPPSVTSLPLDAGKNMVPGAIQGYNDGGAAGYRGPCPPVGDAPHHYFFTVSALNAMVQNFGPETTGARLSFVMSKVAKVLARGQYLGLYGR